MKFELQLLRGIVCDLVIERGEEDFVRSRGDRAVGTVAATGLAAAGLAGAATGALLATTGGGDSVEFFTCTVDGKRVAGRFTKTSFKDGDWVEVAADPQSDGTYAALAVRRPSDQTVWMFPHCSRGSKKHWAYAFQMILVIFFALYFGGVIFFGAIEFSSKQKSDSSYLLFALIMGGALMLAMACHLSISTARRWRTFVQKAEAIFTAFGYHDPSRVDMVQQHKKYLRQHGGKWPYLVEAPWVYQYADAC